MSDVTKITAFPEYCKLAGDIHRVISEAAKDTPLSNAAVIGVLELVKDDLIRDGREGSSDE